LVGNRCLVSCRQPACAGKIARHPGGVARVANQITLPQQIPT
jgi:hypothetical protein